MRILVVGAGGIGGYFGGRLLAAGRDVTFLVRPARAEALARDGLMIRSPAGDLDWPSPPTIMADAIKAPYDLVLLSCKAYDLESAIESFAPAVGPETAILPLLNGMAHLDTLDARFGAGSVLGGRALISTVLDPQGRIVHLGEMQSLSFGVRHSGPSHKAEAIGAELAGAGFAAHLSTEIMLEMWEKWVFIATAAGITSLMRSSIGDIVAAGASDVVTALLDECGAIASRAGYEPREEATGRARTMLTAPGSTLTASMFRDIEHAGRIEADHVIGDLLKRGDGLPSPTLRVVYAHLKAYEARRRREKT